MIFSHVLYQLSYLAQTKNPPEPKRREREVVGEAESYRLSAPARLRGLHVSETVQRTILCIVAPSPFPNVANAAKAAALHKQIAGAGFEPATFGL